MKTCFKCQKQKPHSQFYRHSRMADGYLNKCKECACRDIRKNRQAKREYYLLYDRVRYGTDPERRAENLARARASKYRPATKETKARWIASNPEKRKAHLALYVAQRSGRIKRKSCQVCGAVKSEAHHPDYAQPLRVKWLCDKHHKEEHKRIRMAELISKRRKSKDAKKVERYVRRILATSI